LVQAVEATGADAVYVHIDLDVLDPGAIDGIGSPEPFGVQPEHLADAIRALRARFELAGAGVMEFAPESPDAAGRDLPVILRILGAITGPLTGR
jgi:arginase